MRNAAVVLAAIALLIPAAWAATVDVQRPHITFLSQAQTSTACKAPFRRGCTTLQTEFLCSCAKTGQTWSLQPHIIATPRVYTTTQDIMMHELEHLADLRNSLNEYAATLMLHSFPTEAACTSFSDAEKRDFGSTMRNIQRITVLRRDGERYAERAGDNH